MTTTAEISLDQPRLRKVNLRRDGARLSFRQVMEDWQTDGAFCAWFSQQILQAPFRAVRWETPPVTASTVDRDFEFVLHDAPLLICRPDSRSFAEHFRPPNAAGAVVSFENLSGDAVLVVPTPIVPAADYGHLAAFLRNAPATQIQALWQRVGLDMSRRLNDEPLWLSTAGMGVPWLHVRLDSRPKYYGYQPYAQDTR